MKPKYSIGDKVQNKKEYQWMEVFIGTKDGCNVSPSNIVPKGEEGTIIDIKFLDEKRRNLIKKHHPEERVPFFTYIVKFQKHTLDRNPGTIRRII